MPKLIDTNNLSNNHYPIYYCSISAVAFYSADLARFFGTN